ncbi:hypothetical protein [Vibrio cholerae]|uniref:hypothetical protein n=1 Tax=Vibrio cholerae TaxID=666 RepID=UPI0015608336|nr:hypothetical protein [Vibrio cholerae]NOF88422.1 hypothetical protein [Vibrio cholerae]NOF95279.1 hypothetical protein [Vibrio cholerae]
MNKELEQAMALREEAREMLAQSRVMHEVTLSNQRQVTLAVSTLLPRPMIVEIKVNQQEGEAEKVANFAEDMAASMRIRDVYDIVHAINVLAMANADVVDVNTAFFSESRVFCVRFFTKNESKPLYTEEVNLGCDNALQELLAIESQLTELIIEAREAAEARATEKAEVKA